MTQVMKMAKISKVKLELPDLLGEKYRVKVNYKISFTNLEVQAGAKYRHLLTTIGDDTGTADGIFDDGHDETLRKLRDETITAQSTPISVVVDKGPFNASELDEDFGSDEIRAKVVVKPRPAFAELATAQRESPQVILP
jgi:hypothetical protein